MYETKLTYSEDRLVNHHRRILHSRFSVATFGFSSVLVGLGIIGQMVFQNLLSVCLLGIALLQCCGLIIRLIADLRTLCDCGSVPVLSAKSRMDYLVMERPKPRFKELRENFLLTVLILLYGGAIYCACLVLRIPEPYVAVTTVGVSNAALFVLTLVVCLRPTEPMLFLSRDEVNRLATVRGETVSELEELVEFNLYVGNFRRADEYSRKLLTLAEQRVMG